VTSSTANVRKKRCEVEHEPTRVGVDAIVAAIEELGYRV